MKRSIPNKQMQQFQVKLSPISLRMSRLQGTNRRMCRTKKYKENLRTRNERITKKAILFIWMTRNS